VKPKPPAINRIPKKIPTLPPQSDGLWSRIVRLARPQRTLRLSPGQTVTLRGPVNTADEKAKVEQLAKSAAPPGPFSWAAIRFSLTQGSEYRPIVDANIAVFFSVLCKGISPPTGVGNSNAARKNEFTRVSSADRGQKGDGENQCTPSSTAYRCHGAANFDRPKRSDYWPNSKAVACSNSDVGTKKWPSPIG
jgi:hypothetical protein